MPDLNIVDITLGPSQVQEPIGLFDQEPEEQPRLIAVTIRVRNRSSKALYVMSSIRRIQYDADDRVLHLSLKEPEPEEDPEFLVTRATVASPRFTAVSPNETAAIQVSVPQVYEQLRSFEATDEGLDIERIDISSVERIRCTIAYADTPFEPEERASPEVLLRQLSSWGDSVERTLRPKRQQSDNPDAG